MKLDSIETGFAGTSGGVGEESRQLGWQSADLRQMYVGHALAVAGVERLQLAHVEDFLELRAGECWKPCSDFLIVSVDPAERAAVAGRDCQKLREVSGWVGAASDCQEIDDLNEQPRLAAAGFAYDAGEVFQARQKPVVPNA
jgi:hypothetical protein